MTDAQRRYVVPYSSVAPLRSPCPSPAARAPSERSPVPQPAAKPRYERGASGLAWGRRHRGRVHPPGRADDREKGCAEPPAPERRVPEPGHEERGDERRGRSPAGGHRSSQADAGSDRSACAAKAVQAGTRRPEVLGHRPGPRGDREEVGVTVPARHGVEVNVADDASARASPQVDPEVHPVRPRTPGPGPSRRRLRDRGAPGAPPRSSRRAPPGAQRGSPSGDRSSRETC